MNVLAYINRKFGGDFTCWNFVCFVYRKEFNIVLHPHAVNAAVDLKGAIEVASEELAKPCWIELTEPEPNCLVVLGKRRCGYHAAVMLTETQALHLLEATRKPAVSTLLELAKKFSSIKFYRHALIHSS